jgi:hypothetical protein
MLLDVFEHFSWARSRKGSNPLPLEQQADGLDDVRLIIGHEDARAVVGGWFSRFHESIIANIFDRSLFV